MYKIQRFKRSWDWSRWVDLQEVYELNWQNKLYPKEAQLFESLGAARKEVKRQKWLYPHQQFRIRKVDNGEQNSSGSN